ncbi:HD domain-containing protein [Actinoplanes sp. NBRC 103695]|uniref:HD domain-containing protein n=1 Tax=Actinoplanes sp. NBRC 103695 TaxID=3032202 RepID=UPI0024A26B83|nr:HD domain-containing protein [Actinoplanes sp. NBRC 103695]GLY97025.1 hypothetical protein Acsp02_42790 [Actinoplanes sp. NBRC 103695]
MDLAPGLADPALQSSTLRKLVVEHVSRSEPAAVAHHSLRTYFFATKAAEFRRLRRDVDYDDDALFFATVLHDLGLTREGDIRPDRFEIAGADLAVEFLREHGVQPETTDLVWDAIALHTVPGLAQRKSILCDLTFAGSALDFGQDSDFLSEQDAAAINDAFPRLDVVPVMTGLVVRQAERNRAKAPHLSAADIFYRAVHGGDPDFLSRWGNS